VDDDLVAKEQKAKDAEDGRAVEKQIDLRHICLLILSILIPTLRHDDHGAQFLVGIDEASSQAKIREGIAAPERIANQCCLGGNTEAALPANSENHCWTPQTCDDGLNELRGHPPENPVYGGAYAYGKSAECLEVAASLVGRRLSASCGCGTRHIRWRRHAALLSGRKVRRIAVPVIRCCLLKASTGFFC
jgi:hypothetical protein